VFVGHFAVALAAKRAAPRLPLGTLVLAAQLADLVWPVLVLAGVERFEIRPGITAVTPLDFIHYPYSHSLLALALWGGVLAGACYAWTRRAGMSAVLFLVVLSHWLLDYVSHRPDMPLTVGGGERFGLGLWDSVAATLAVEAAMFAAGIAVYLRTTRPLDRTGRWAFAAFVAFLSVIYVASVFGPPPPSIDAVAWSALGIWLFVAWAYWIDRHRAASIALR
jgi:FtsH-binding integral membrane protein